MLVLRWPRWARRGERRGWGAPSLSLSPLEESLTAAVSGFTIDNYRRSPRADPAVLSRDSSAGSWRRTCAAVPACITHASAGARGVAAGAAMVTARRGQTGSADEEDGCNFCMAFAVTGSELELGERGREIFLCAIRSCGCSHGWDGGRAIRVVVHGKLARKGERERCGSLGLRVE
jgi:hypothetical protein